MPHYSDEQARAVFNRDKDEVSAYYQRLAEQQRPVVERAIANLTGQPQAEATGSSDVPDTTADEDDEPENLPPEVSSGEVSEGGFPGDPAPEA